MHFTRYKKFKNRTGEIHSTNNGRVIEIINYRKSTDVDIKFEDGIIVKNLAYGNIKKGRVKYPSKTKLEGVKYITSKGNEVEVLSIDLVNSIAVIEVKPNSKCIVDIEDLDLVCKYKWYERNVNGNIYAVSRTDDKELKGTPMHRLIMGVSDSNIIVDHINRITLDNRKSELRVCTKRENSLNRRGAVKSTSQYKGVSWSTDRQKWCVTITINKKSVSLGRYENEIEAARVYDNKAREIHKEFAYLNFP